MLGETVEMRIRRAVSRTRQLVAWPLLRQVREKDARGLGLTARSTRSAQLVATTAEADQVVRSICLYCAFGCGQLVYVKRGRVVQIEGDPDSPISGANDLLSIVLDPNVHIQECKAATCDIRSGRRLT